MAGFLGAKVLPGTAVVFLGWARGFLGTLDPFLGASLLPGRPLTFPGTAAIHQHNDTLC